MEYRKMEKLNVSTSLLGFGCMRFPTNAEGKIDEKEAEKLIDKAIAEGVNYIDTAYPYHNGESEPFVGKVLDKYDRNSYYLATKLPCWEVKTLDDAKRIFESQLKRLNKEYIDFYLLHALGRDRWNNMLNLGVVEYFEKLKEEGKIKFLGFSFHDEYDVFKEIITFRKWDFCQIQLNYMDTNVQAGLEGYKLTEELKIPLIIMEPVKGGSLAKLPSDITNFFKGIAPDNSIASWAFRWVGSLPNTKVILSGMSAMEQVEDNLKTFSNFKKLSETESNAVDTSADMLRKRVRNGCTDCKYCMPCPAGVNIPRNFQIWNKYGMYENVNDTVWEWNRAISDKAKAKNCISCGKCEKVCPQKISIREDLSKLQKEFDNLSNIEG